MSSCFVGGPSTESRPALFTPSGVSAEEAGGHGSPNRSLVPQVSLKIMDQPVTITANVIWCDEASQSA